MWDAIAGATGWPRCPAGTVYSVGTRDERRHERHTKAGSGRRQRSTGGLSQQQRSVLTWIAAREQATRGGARSAVDFLFKKYLDNPDASVSPKERASLSRSLARLEERGLLVRVGSRGGPASRVRLTAAGRSEAARLQEAAGLTTAQVDRKQRLRARSPKAALLLDVFRAADVPVEIRDGRIVLTRPMPEEDAAVAAARVATQLEMAPARIQKLLANRVGPVSRELDLSSRLVTRAAQADSWLITYLARSLRLQRGPQLGAAYGEWEQVTKPDLERSVEGAKEAICALAASDRQALQSAQANLLSALLDVAPPELADALNILSLRFEVAADEAFASAVMAGDIGDDLDP